ncbi:hypothetical protein N0V88_001377 [Collariella sp. IMI 366227]|nr:hypothetical protein N0V88_001377 [Collariella sp. IMI 366227]
MTQEEVVTLASLVWLPGPEGMLRFWSAAGKHREESKKRKGGKKPAVAITVFTGGSSSSSKGKGPAAAENTTFDEEKGEHLQGLWPTSEEVASRKEPYYPPAWANPLFDVVHTQRVAGSSSGLLTFEQSEIIFTGIRGLAKAVLARDSRLKPVEPAKNVAVGPGDGSKPAGALAAAFQPPVVVVAAPDDTPTLADTAEPVGAKETSAEGDMKGKGKDFLAPSPASKGQGSEDESPDTLVNTPPLERSQ